MIVCIRNQTLITIFLQEVGNYFGTNSRGRGRHSRAIGWQPKLGTHDMLDSIDAEVDAILKQQNKA